ncbi:hypothetical protein ABB37_07035 [Leptomonas pyrrhocoris]|uniref:Uncharacterized protein n=1 Tax=Leptomonas pyrrhocoris TaxID=157538 RepID=A0A0M9FX10_LEPPY|nr:hypothetical protein ABB37_07035 [Leptomonas pyrrhocoris]KPA77713.1 hypothetical protein ABB37_07035 [Leptomonas pyrrhocoris]|eukprot:XP_015656152.1 hypothetical protein ABB37_07035 [Leptomonas pyrrhocoris]
MFTPAQVDQLFASTALTLRRSQVLFDERRTSVVSTATLPSTFCQSTVSAASTAVGAAAASAHSTSSSSSSFAETVRSLQSLGQFRAFVEAIAAMQTKVENELHTPSTALHQRRSKGHDFALLQSVTRGLRGATAALRSTSPVTAALWSGGAASDESEEALDEVQSSSVTSAATSSSAVGGLLSGRHPNVLSSGAQVTATLLFGALCVDVALAAPRAAPAIAADLLRVFASEPHAPDASSKESGPDSADAGVITITEWSREGSLRLRTLLQDVAALLPKGVMGRFVRRVADLLLQPSSLALLPRGGPSHLGCRQLSGGQFLLPLFDSYVLEHYPSTLASRWFLRPLQTTAQHLRADYYRSTPQFSLQCRWLLGLVFVLVRAYQAAAAVEASSSAAGRPLRTIIRVYDAWLMPLEKTFGHDAARHGMSTAFFENLVLPHSLLVRQLRSCKEGPRSPDTGGGDTAGGARAWSSLLHTAHYRLLMVAEKLARSEVAQVNGTSSTASRQRTYETLLRQNGGKVSVPLLQTLAEDRQLVLEATPSRSPDGHRLYRLHDGMPVSAGGAAKAVFVYVDDGALFTKVGRSRVFQRVKSVEDIFRSLP